MGFVKEFKEFAMKGNVMDMAVGVIIGGAFGKIVTSLPEDHESRRAASPRCWARVQEQEPLPSSC